MKGTFKKVLAMALAMTMAVGVLTGCGGKDPVADTSASGETAAAGSEATGTTGTADTFTYAIGGDPGANVNVITTSDRFGLMTIKMIYSPLCMCTMQTVSTGSWQQVLIHPMTTQSIHSIFVMMLSGLMASHLQQMTLSSLTKPWRIRIMQAGLIHSLFMIRAQQRSRRLMITQ